MKNQRNYFLDSSIAKIRKTIKAALPESIINLINEKKSISPSVFVGQLMTEVQPPWSSPNVWNEITTFYRDIENPTLFEYGTGYSSIWHLENFLQKRNGHYVGVEIDENWFWAVVGALLKVAGKSSSSTTLAFSDFINDSGLDAIISCNNVTATVKLRKSTSDYIAAIPENCNAVIIDGAFRKQCVDYILENECIRDNGLLMLMEAGRGQPDWWEGKLHGDRDYSDQVEALSKLGGIFIHGDGVDSWPNCNRTSPRPTSYYNPMEAMKLIVKKKN